jgi:membrane-associated protein
VTELGEWLLTGLLNHGNTLLGVTLFFAALGIPLPATMLLMAAGVLAATTGAVAGDACSYLLGRFSLNLLPARLLASGGWGQAAAFFARWGGWSVFVTRFLLTPAALPVNLLAGSSLYAWPRFMAAVVTGEALWVLLFGGIGHLFADQWESISRLAGDLVGLLVGATLAVVGLYLLAANRKRSPGGGGG